MLARFGEIINNHSAKCLLLIVWISLLVIFDAHTLLGEYGGYAFLGVLGAIFANATGAGGGVVFVPFFNQLALSNETIVATSFAIQCCGMTAGALTWFRHYRYVTAGSSKNSSKNSSIKTLQQTKANEVQGSANQWQALPGGVMLIAPFSVTGIWIAQFGLADYTAQVQSGLHFYFGLFSIVLALCIYASIPLMKKEAVRSIFTRTDNIALVAIGLFGGIITAWLSVGVGELIAVYLILRGFNISFAIALAVIVSALSVQGAIFYHLFVSQAIYWQVLIFAGAGAIVGGMIAKHVVLYFSPKKLKVFFASWVLIMGAAGLPF